MLNMVYAKVTRKPTTSSIYIDVKKDTCLIPVCNTSIQIPNHDSRILWIQPIARPSISHVKNTFKSGKL